MSGTSLRLVIQGVNVGGKTSGRAGNKYSSALQLVHGTEVCEPQREIFEGGEVKGVTTAVQNVKYWSPDSKELVTATAPQCQLLS